MSSGGGVPGVSLDNGEDPVRSGPPDALEEKARRYLAEGRVRFWTSSWRGATATVSGDHGVYTTSVDAAGSACSCPSMVADCAHVIAVRLIWEDEMTEDLDPERPFTVEDVPIPGQEVLPAEGYEEARLAHDADTTVDVESGEVLEVAVPSRADLDLAQAPVTWNTLKSIADTELVNGSLRGRPYAMYAALLYGRELGIGPMQSLQHIAVIDGSAVLSAELQLSRFRHAGHRLAVLRADDHAVALKGTRGDTGDELEIVYELEDAVAADLVELDEQGKPRKTTRSGKAMPWQTYTSDLIWARAVTRLVRRLAPDVLGRPG